MFLISLIHDHIISRRIICRQPIWPQDLPTNAQHPWILKTLAPYNFYLVIYFLTWQSNGWVNDITNNQTTGTGHILEWWQLQKYDKDQQPAIIHIKQQVVWRCVPPSPSSIIWYRPSQGGDLFGWESNHWSGGK